MSNTNKPRKDIALISVKDRLPSRSDVRDLEKGKKMMFGFRVKGEKLEGCIVFFNSERKEFGILKPTLISGEKGYKFENVTDLIDYWALLTLDEANALFASSYQGGQE